MHLIIFQIDLNIVINTMSEEDVPALDDFEDELKSIDYNSKKKYGSQDYAKPDLRHLQQGQQKQQIAKIQKKVQNISLDIEKKKPKEDYGGFKKGFLSGSSSNKKTEKITQVKPTSKKNPLEIKQVQDAMSMNNYLQQTRTQWMTQNFVDSVSSNQKINKLFTNPEYMKAIDMFKTNPKQAMAKYGNNKQFMEAFQQFCKMMGMQFQSLSANAKK